MTQHFNALNILVKAAERYTDTLDDLAKTLVLDQVRLAKSVIEDMYVRYDNAEAELNAYRYAPEPEQEIPVFEEVDENVPNH